jgi:O-antigen/teichoic acid export membrane protein
VTTIARRTAILAFARLTNQALAFLSPLFLVRLFTVDQYGQYRDFLLYGTILMPWVQLAINSSLAYLLPKEPHNDRRYLSQATILIFASSLIVSGLVFVVGESLPSATIRSFIYPLCLYVIFFANLDAWEFYWLAKRKSVNVLVYSTSRLGLRMLVVVVSAYVTRNVEQVIWSLVAFEGLRCVALVLYGLQNRLFTRQFDWQSVKFQLAYSLPLGASGIIWNLNNYLGQFVISMQLGPATLAVYTVGTYFQPIVHIFRNSIADVIMPEVVSKHDAPPQVALRLWQRATVVYSAVMLPGAVLLFYYADVVVRTLFTSAYVAAVPVFQIFTLILVRECFDLGLPLRAVNKTHVFFSDGVISLVVNFGVMLSLFGSLGVLAPAVSMIVARFTTAAYLSFFVIRYCGFTLGNMLPWWEIGKIALCSLLCVSLLLLGEKLDLPPLLRAILFGSIYMLVYVGLLSITGIHEITTAIDRARLRISGKPGNP